MKGQTEWVGHAKGAYLYITGNEVVYTNKTNVHMRLVGASAHPRVEGILCFTVDLGANPRARGVSGSTGKAVKTLSMNSVRRACTSASFARQMPWSNSTAPTADSAASAWPQTTITYSIN